MHCMFDSQLPLLQVATKLAAAAAVANVAPLLAATSAALIRRRRIVKLFDILTSHLVAKCRAATHASMLHDFQHIYCSSMWQIENAYSQEGRRCSQANYVKVGRGRLAAAELSLAKRLAGIEPGLIMAAGLVGNVCNPNQTMAQTSTVRPCPRPCCCPLLTVDNYSKQIRTRCMPPPVAAAAVTGGKTSDENRQQQQPQQQRAV